MFLPQLHEEVKMRHDVSTLWLYLLNTVYIVCYFVYAINRKLTQANIEMLLNLKCKVFYSPTANLELNHLKDLLYFL